ncbi:MAG TPA: hypothetical protein DCR46_07235, partial [Cytophagales bacterium]|nr:hypothetical protein [Cytophagales bacterium]
MKKPISLKLLVRLFAILSITSISVEAQNNCPSLPKKSNFDTLTFIKTETPTDPSKATGIWLGQGTILRNGTEKRPAFIPSNRPTWAIAIAHAWNYHRNIIKRVNYPKIGYWMATMVQESELGCVDDNVWDAPYKISANQAKATTLMYHTGCYQIEGPGTAYAQLNQNYPYGRFPINSYKAFMEGRDNMETSSLVKSYFDVYTPYVYNYIKGWKLYESIDCTKDPLAYEKSSASGFNGGINLFANASNFFNRTQDNNACWAGLPATTAAYGEDLAKWTSVLEDMKNYCQYPTGSTFDSYYNVAIKWSDITNYLTIINKIYPEINFATKVIPNVQKAFEKIAGSTTGTIPFKQLGPVIDQIILSLPAEYPQTVEGSPIGSLKCSGKTIPYGHFEILNGSNNFCLGNSVTLNLVVDGGGGTATTFKWYKGSVSPANQIANTQSVTITPTSTGTFVYTAEICNSDGCYQVNTNSSTSDCLDSRNILGVQIKVNQCSSCSTLVSATSVNTPCKGMAKGQINLTITNPPANYKVSYKGTTPTGNFSGSFNASGSTASIKNVRDGAYNIIIEDLSNGTCKAYTNVIVGFTTLINEYVKAKITSTAACKANLQADIIKLPSPCRWKVEAFAPVYFQWENWMNIGISTSTGASSLEKWTNFYPKPSTYDQYSDAQVFEGYYYLASDESMTINMAVTNTPGASQIYSYKVNIYDDANKLVKTYDVPAGSAKGDQPYTVGTYTVTCPFTPPNAYNFTWNPTINNQTNTASKSTGNVNVSSTNDVMYTVTATNTTNTQCVLNDSVKVLKDPSCAPVCTKPTDVISLNATNSTLTGCSPTTGKIETNTLTNGLAYQWYFDGGSGYTAYTGTGNNGTVSGNKVTLSNLTQNGNYRLRLAGLSSDMNTATCYVEQTFAVSITTTPSKPSISGTSTYCESDNISLTANKGNTTDLVTTWEWKLGTTILSGNTASYSKLNAVIADGGSYTLVAKNGSCSSTASSALAVTVTAKPTFTITSPPSQCGGSIDLATTYSNLSAGTMKYYNDALATTLLGSSIVSTSGSYYLQATSGTCKSSIQTVVVSFKSPPVPPTVQTINYCKDVTASALTATGTALKWYADNLSSTSISTPTPNTSTVGTIDYYVTQTVNGCERNRT